jgi:hypothetical protein
MDQEASYEEFPVCKREAEAGAEKAQRKNPEELEERKEAVRRGEELELQTQEPNLVQQVTHQADREHQK